MTKKLQGVGASVLRKEDDRYLRGRGQFVGDIKIPGMLDVAFVRSPIAHGLIKAIHRPEGFADRIFTMADCQVLSRFELFLDCLDLNHQTSGH